MRHWVAGFIVGLVLLAGCLGGPPEGESPDAALQFELALVSPDGNPAPTALPFDSGSSWLLSVGYQNPGVGTYQVEPCDHVPIWEDPIGITRRLLGSCDAFDLPPGASETRQWRYERVALQQSSPEPRPRLVPLEGIHEFRIDNASVRHDVHHIPESAVWHRLHMGWSFAAWISNETWHGAYHNAGNETIASITDEGSCSGTRALMVPTNATGHLLTGWGGPCLGGYSPQKLDVARPGESALVSWRLDDWHRARAENATGVVMLLWPEDGPPQMSFPEGYEDVRVHLQLRGPHEGTAWFE